ncbi:MAG: hypothetical protein H0U76_21545, partial [Ktedonobacteraceae bacterium]|nr:hypothetical protein [Ktedonobacteraceae bacterium]
SISGGRRLMTFLSFSAALLYFETPDELLHLYTPESIKERDDYNGNMHIAPGDGRRLIAVPFARAAQPFLASMVNRTPSATIQTQREQQQREEHQRCQQVIDALKDGPRRALQALAQGLHPDDVAKMLDLKPSTISFYTTEIYQLCRNAWDIPPGQRQRIDYRFIQIKFADYFHDAYNIS